MSPHRYGICTLFRGAPGVCVMKTKPSGLKILTLPEHFHLATQSCWWGCWNAGKGRAARHDAAQRECEPPFYSWDGLRTRGQRFAAGISWCHEFISDIFNMRVVKIAKAALQYRIQSNDAGRKGMFLFFIPPWGHLLQTTPEENVMLYNNANDV